jgi:hypothetical protein
MNWKFKASLFVAALLIAAVCWLKLPFRADANAAGAAEEIQSPTGTEQSKTTQYQNGVMKIEPLHFAVSGKVRDMPAIDENAFVKSAAFKDVEARREERREREMKAKGVALPEGESEEINERNAERVKHPIPGAGAGAGDGNFQDPLIGKKSLVDSPQAMPTPSLTFDGATAADNAAQGIGGLTPPDVNGDVGLNHYVSSVNLVLKMFNKSTGAVAAGPIKTNALFASLPAGDPCRVDNDGDPIVLYDTLADRWHISQFGIPAGNQTYQCVAVSQTGDPTGAYYVWSYLYQNNVFNDYPKVGVWTDAYHMTFNQFNIAGTAFLGLGILSQDRTKALAGDPTASAVYINIGAIDPNSGGSLPGDIDGYTPPPPGMAEVIGEYRADEFGDPVDGIRMYKWVPNFANPGSSTLTVLSDVALAPFDARQPNTRNAIEVQGATSSQYLDSVADRSMHRFAYRNFGTITSPINSYVGNFAVNVSGVNPTTAATYQTGIRWFEMRRTNDSFSVFDQGTHTTGAIDPVNGLNNWMGSIAQDARGDIALGFSQAGTGQKADIKIAGRTNNVANSGTLNEGEALFYPAGGIQTSTGGRWGDYSAMTPDPSDGCTFWYTQEYYATTSSTGWSTRVGKFRFPACTDEQKGTITGTVTNCATGATIDKANVSATGGFNRQTGAPGTFSMITAPGTYTVSASKFGYASGGTVNATVTNGGTATANVCLTPVAVVASGGAPTLSAESCGTNGVPDPGETLSITLPLKNSGAADTTNLTATLLSTGGVTALNNPQSYGAVAANGGTASRTFNFRVDSTIACGSTVKLTFRLNDGANDLGTVTQNYTTGVRSVSLTENFDGVTAPALPAGWTSVQTSGTGISWVTSTTTPFSAPNDAFANDPTTVNAAALVSPAVTITGADAQISFKNNYNTEASGSSATLGYDGMVLEYSTNGGSTWTDVITGGGSFASGGYNRTISTGFSSPISGRAAWSGNSGGYIDTVVNLPASLNGQSVKFRWVMASDNDTGGTGVRIDNVQVFGARTCSSCAAGACRVQRRADFTNDAKADYSVFRPSTGTWFVLTNGAATSTAGQFGASGDKLQPQDYDGDGKTDFAVFRGGSWYVLKSSDGTFNAYNWGLSSDIPVAADYTGDGKADVAVYRPSSGAWFILRSDNNTLLGNVWGGDATDVPVVGDFDGDCRTDLAVRRTVNSPVAGDTTYYIFGSTAGFLPVRWGRSDMQIAIGDYNGDGKSDVGVVDSDYRWYIANANPQGQQLAGVQFGAANDIVVPADYDGDGKTDFGVYRPSSNFFFTAPTTTANPSQNFNSVQWGVSGDLPTARWNQYPLP